MTEDQKNEFRQFIRENLSIQVTTDKDSDYYGNYSLDITVKLVFVNQDGSTEDLAQDTAHEWFSH